jgi:hypothetical protein
MKNIVGIGQTIVDTVQQVKQGFRVTWLVTQYMVSCVKKPLTNERKFVMFKKSLAIVALAIQSVSLHAAIITSDLNASGDALITKDTVSGLEWLDLTVTSGLTYDAVFAELGVGGDYEGWAFASESQLNSLWSAFGDAGPYTGQSTIHNQAFDNGLLTTWGILNTQSTASQSFFLWDNVPSSGTHSRGRVLDYVYSGYLDAIFTSVGAQDDSVSAGTWTGSALVRDINAPTSSAVVPEPATLTIFGLGLMGLVSRQFKKQS